MPRRIEWCEDIGGWRSDTKSSIDCGARACNADLLVFVSASVGAFRGSRSAASSGVVCDKHPRRDVKNTQRGNEASQQLCFTSASAARTTNCVRPPLSF